MKLLIEKSVPGRRSHYLEPGDVPQKKVPDKFRRAKPPILPEISETELCRHYSALESRTFGVNDGFYPLGSCTMKYNPKINEKVSSLPGFTGLHPLQPASEVQGILKAIALTADYLKEITGMDHMSFTPAAGAHGELCSLMMFKRHFETKGEKRTKVLVPDSAHGTNPATVSMCGMESVNLPSNAKGCVDMDELRAAIAANKGQIVGIMLTNPNTLGIFEEDIEEITRLVHEEGGLCYYDGANLNAIAGTIRPGDMGFDCVHLNLHKTFSTPHGGGGPGCGAIGCKDFLHEYLPTPILTREENFLEISEQGDKTIGRILSFYGNILVVLRALSYIMSYGGNGIPLMSKHAVLNANYLQHRLSERFAMSNTGLCMHEFVMSMEKEAAEHNVTAKDLAKAMLDHGMMAPTIYFPLIVKEALMVEPTETEGKETLDQVADDYNRLYDEAMANPEKFVKHPQNTPIGRPDEVLAARKPKVVW
ncbi:MAG: aminomethyl-transferring glycine dehydrogenase subunit GcvPB [Turicibacter sp.]|nr:aminomethyl-transferring glycine dehydrogenase subunit GcvPB [Turicibacter sp.]